MQQDYLLDFWNETQKILSQRLNISEYELWIYNLEYIKSEESSKIYIRAPHTFYISQLIKHEYDKKIESTLAEISGKPITVEFISDTKKIISNNTSNNAPMQPPIQQEVEYTSPPKPIPQNNFFKNTQTIIKDKKETFNNKIMHPSLNENYTFENFIPGNNNFAHSVALAIAEQPGVEYNPCLIYGGVGLGKTHLIQSIGHKIYQNNPNAKIIYVSAEQFVREFVESIRKRETPIFTQRYRNADILLIDDIHDLQHKKETQEELFHTFNSLYDANKQMVFTCDRPPKELVDLTERLKSRFTRGINVNVLTPSFDTRYAILKKKLESKQINIPENVIDFTARSIDTNIRDLENALNQILTYSKIINSEITIEVAKNQMANMKETSNIGKEKLTVERILKLNCEFFNVNLEELLGKKRDKNIATIRQIVIFLCSDLSSASISSIGKTFTRDHSTIIYAINNIKEKSKKDINLEDKINKAKQYIIEQA